MVQLLRLEPGRTGPAPPEVRGPMSAKMVVLAVLVTTYIVFILTIIEDLT